MDHATRLKMLTLAESKPPKPILLQMESGLGATDTTVDDHLKHAVHHAAASLTATRQGNHEDAAKHKQAANTHLLHASQKQNAEEHPGSHQGEKMVFGVWRKVGGDLSPAEHQKLGDDYTKHATRQKSRIDARAMLGGVHPHEVPEADKAHHYHEVKQALAMAKTHYAGQDPMKHTGDAGTQRTGPSGKPTVTAREGIGEADTGGHQGQKMVFGVWRKVGANGSMDPASLQDAHHEHLELTRKHHKEAEKHAKEADAHTRRASQLHAAGHAGSAEEAHQAAQTSTERALTALRTSSYHNHAAGQLMTHMADHPEAPFEPDEQGARSFADTAVRAAKTHVQKHGARNKGVSFVSAGRDHAIQAHHAGNG